MLPWSELVHPDDAITLVREAASAAPFAVQLLACEPDDGRRALEALQVTTRSPLGAVALHTGGIRIDRGWLRVLGAGCSAFPRTIHGWNRVNGDKRHPPGLLVADDAIGGFFALSESTRTIWFLPPDSLQWEDLELGYGDWLTAMMTQRLDGFYGPIRWPGWETEVEPLDGGRGLHIYPPLVATGPRVGDRGRKVVPIDELWSFQIDLSRQLEGQPDGTMFRISVDE